MPTNGNRIDKLDAPLGNLKVDYAVTIVGQTDPASLTEYELSISWASGGRGVGMSMVRCPSWRMPEMPR
jgi:hypothetical protein